MLALAGSAEMVVVGIDGMNIDPNVQSGCRFIFCLFIVCFCFWSMLDLAGSAEMVVIGAGEVFLHRMHFNDMPVILKLCMHFNSMLC